MAKKVVMLFSMSFAPYQGRYYRVFSEAQSLRRAGYTVTLLAWDRECTQPSTQDVAGIQVERFAIHAGVGQGPLRNAVPVLRFNLRSFARLLQHDFDIVHCFNLDTMLPGLLAARIRRTPIVLDLCEPEYYAFWDDKYAAVLSLVRRLEKFCALRFSAVFVHNLYQLEKFRHYGVKQVEQVGTYPPLSLTATPAGQAQHNSRLITIGRIGTIYEDNGIEELVAAFSLLCQRRRNVRLLLAGRVYDTYRETFSQLIAPLGEHVRVTGPFPSEELPRLYQEIHISVMLNRRTPWFRHITPTKLFDSMACGVPVVASDIGEVKAILEEYRCGVTVDEQDPQAVAQVLESLVDDPQRRQEMAKNGKQAARERFNWEAAAKNLLRVYNQLASSRESEGRWHRQLS